jgi:hypothetical protein
MHIMHESSINSQKKGSFDDGNIRIIHVKHNRMLKSKIMVTKIGSEHKYSHSLRYTDSRPFDTKP